LDRLLSLLVYDADLEKEQGELKDVAQYVMDLYVPREEGAEPKPLIDRLDETEGHIKGLLLDTANLAATAALSTVKYHDPSFDLQKVSKMWTCLASSGVRTSWQPRRRSSRSSTSALTEVVLK
jgi:hypothetical protein